MSTIILDPSSIVNCQIDAPLHLVSMRQIVARLRLGAWSL